MEQFRVRLYLGDAMRTDSSHQSLGNYPLEGGRNDIWLYLHIHQPCDGCNRAVGMQGGKNEMPGQRRLECYVSCLEIPHLADQDDVGILPQGRAENLGESKSDLLAHGNLGSLFEKILYRLLYRLEILARVHDRGKNRVEHGGLAAAGRAGADDYPLRSRRHQLKPLEISRHDAQIAQPLDSRAFVKYPQDNLFPIDGREAGDPHIDNPDPRLDRDPAVLRASALCYVHLCQDLQP